MILEIQRWDGGRFRKSEHDCSQHPKTFYPNALGHMGATGDIRLKNYTIESVGIYPQLNRVIVYITQKATVTNVESDK